MEKPAWAVTTTLTDLKKKAFALCNSKPNVAAIVCDINQPRILAYENTVLFRTRDLNRYDQWQGYFPNDLYFSYNESIDFAVRTIFCSNRNFLKHSFITWMPLSTNKGDFIFEFSKYPYWIKEEGKKETCVILSILERQMPNTGTPVELHVEVRNDTELYLKKKNFNFKKEVINTIKTHRTFNFIHEDKRITQMCVYMVKGERANFIAHKLNFPSTQKLTDFREKYLLNPWEDIFGERLYSNDIILYLSKCGLIPG